MNKLYKLFKKFLFKKWRREKPKKVVCRTIKVGKNHNALTPGISIRMSTEEMRQYSELSDKDMRRMNKILGGTKKNCAISILKLRGD